MKNLFVIFGLCTVLATETLAAKTQTAEGDRACQEENGRFTYDHPTFGRLTELTQAGLDSMRASAGESTTSAKPIGECPEPKISNVEAIKNWFKRVTDNDEQVNGEKRPTGPSTEDAKSTHTAKSGVFEAILLMTQDPEKILTQNLGMSFTLFEESVSINLGEGIEALLLIRGCSKDSAGKCLVTADYVIKSPDGSTYRQALNTDVWKEAAALATQYSLTNSRIGFVLQQDADPGLYEVYVTVSDKISNSELSLTGKVLVNKIPLEEKENIQDMPEEGTNPQRKTSLIKDISGQKG
jgi:hypothetical protein